MIMHKNETLLLFQVAQIIRDLSGWGGENAPDFLQIVSDNLKGEIAPFSFPLLSGGEEVKGSPLVYIPHLVDMVIHLLDENER